MVPPAKAGLALADGRCGGGSLLRRRLPDVARQVRGACLGLAGPRHTIARPLLGHLNGEGRLIERRAATTSSSLMPPRVRKVNEIIVEGGRVGRVGSLEGRAHVVTPPPASHTVSSGRPAGEADVEEVAKLSTARPPLPLPPPSGLRAERARPALLRDIVAGLPIRPGTPSRVTDPLHGVIASLDTAGPDTGPSSQPAPREVVAGLRAETVRPPARTPRIRPDRCLVISVLQTGGGAVLATETTGDPTPSQPPLGFPAGDVARPADPDTTLPPPLETWIEGI